VEPSQSGGGAPDDPWDDLRKRGRRYRTTGVSVPVLLALMSLVGPASWCLAMLVLVAAAAAVIAFFAAAGSYERFRCPRCGGLYFRPGAWSVNPLRKTCAHCGLRKWEPLGDASNAG